MIYIDDIVLIGNYIDEINPITSMANQSFKIKNLGDLT